jgi:hypothetical protein
MKHRRVLVALVIALLFYATSDILLWQRIFEGHDLFQFEYQYQSGHVATLVALIAVGMILLWNRWALWYGAALYTLTFSGLEDILYYWLDGRSVPYLMRWMDHGPLILFQPATVTSTTLYISSGIWVGLWLAVLLLAPIAKRLLVIAGLHYHEVIAQGKQDHRTKQQSEPELTPQSI